MVARLREKAAEMEDMNRKLMEADLFKTEFLTRVSHELRTPLNSIKGSVYYLDSSNALTSEERKEFYSIIAKETDKLATIVENQLYFLSCEDDMVTAGKLVINLADILTEVCSSKTLTEQLERAGISISVQLENRVQDILGDKFRINQMFLTLLECLISDLQEGSIIEIETTEDDEIRVTIRVNCVTPAGIHEVFSRPNILIRKEDNGENVKIYLVRKTAEIHGWELGLKENDDSFSLVLSIPRSRRQTMDAAVGKGIEMFLEFIAELMGLSTCSVMLCDEVTGDLRIQSAMGLDEDIIKTTRIRPGDQISGWVALEGKPVLIEDIERHPRFARKSIPQYNTKSLISVPLKVRDSVTGVLNLNNKKSAKPFTTQDLTLAAVFGTRVSYLIEKLRAGENWEESFGEFTASFNKLINAGRKYHKKGTLLPDLVMKVMEKLGASEVDSETALYVSTVFDLGLMFTDDVVLRKNKLDPAEVASLKAHPFTTVELLNGIEFSPKVNKAILHHHEKFDGTGYPDGLAGDAIPLISRVIAVVDAYCAMVSRRPHRKELTVENALREISNGAGSSYDPVVVAALKHVIAARD
jgi:hypothetical protein